MTLYRSFATVGGLTMISRIFGFIRDIFIAAVLGTGLIADAFFVAFRLPNLFRRLFGEGAFNSAFIPLFAKRLESDGPDAARGFAEQAMTGLLVCLITISIIAMLAMPWIMHVIAPGFADDRQKFDLAVLLSQIAFPYLLCMSLVALLSGVLNSFGRFAESASVSIILNVTLIAAMLIAIALGYRNEPRAGIALAWGVFAAGILQLAVLLLGIRRIRFKLHLRRPRWNDDMRQLVMLGIPGIVAGGITQINILVGTIIASLQDGAVSHLYFADRVYELPLALVGIAVGVVLLPDLSRNLRAGNDQHAMNSLNRSLEFALLLTIPAAVALAVIPWPIVHVLFERGAFTSADTTATAAALAIFAAGLPSFVLIKVFSPAFFAREDTRTPMRIAGISLTINTLASIALFYVFRMAGWMPHLGIALATVIGGWLNAMLLVWILTRRGQFVADRQIVTATPKIIVASAVMGVTLWLLAIFLAPYLAKSSGFLLQVSALGAIVIAGMIVYFTFCHISGAARLNQLLAALRRGG